MIESVSSPNNPIIKMAASLKQKKKRDELGLFSAEGLRLVEEAAESDWKNHILIITDQLSKTPRAQDIIVKLGSEGCRILEVPMKIYERISDTDQPQGIMLLLEKHINNLSGFFCKETPLIAILDCVQDPGNVGTLIRTADAVGCSAVIMTTGCADLFSGKTIRSSMGSIFHLPVYTDVSFDEIIHFTRTRNIKLVSTSLESSELFCKANFTHSTAIVFGNEGNGVSRELLAFSDSRLHIPIVGRAESLNVAAAAAVILYEAVRQRGQLSCN
ncbi:23S rRNA (uridine(2479)-2'-O)-methyltransferase [bioreactor metagenome]|uniref:23S rRNA (Uridine(2479)-2'-O)-methyltransferase n=1 Tax=bioreactor metagenome TaxID=1076179 RepID=A0A644VIV2_9ZZZZ|nr:RNA methyltransferase [Negativicutes bacterium]